MVKVEVKDIEESEPQDLRRQIGVPTESPHLRGRRLSRLRSFTVVGVLSTAALAGALLLPASAFAGTNGQEIEVFTHNSYSIQICGTNQNNNYVCGAWNTPGYANPISGWWWKGTARIVYCYGYNLTGCYAVGYYNIPVSQPNPWVYIYYN
jgi:hypothetical protein